MFRQNDPFINDATNGLTFGLGRGAYNSGRIRQQA